MISPETLREALAATIKIVCNYIDRTAVRDEDVDDAEALGKVLESIQVEADPPQAEADRPDPVTPEESASSLIHQALHADRVYDLYTAAGKLASRYRSAQREIERHQKRAAAAKGVIAQTHAVLTNEAKYGDLHKDANLIERVRGFVQKAQATQVHLDRTARAIVQLREEVTSKNAKIRELEAQLDEANQYYEVACRSRDELHIAHKKELEACASLIPLDLRVMGEDHPLPDLVKHLVSTVQHQETEITSLGEALVNAREQTKEWDNAHDTACDEVEELRRTVRRKDERIAAQVEVIRQFQNDATAIKNRLEEKIQLIPRD